MKTINIIGDLNVDIVLSGLREIPALGKEILATQRSIGPGGSAANTALVLASLGSPVKLYSRIGNDLQGNNLLALLARHRISTAGIVRTDTDMTGITVSLAYPEERMYVTCAGTVASTTLDDLPDGYLAAGNHLHLASYFLQKGLRPAIGALLEKAKTCGMTTSLDPGGDPEQRWDFSLLEPYLQHLDWLLPNTDEIRGISGISKLSEALDSFSPNTPGLVVKAGKNGVWLRYHGKIECFPVKAIKVIDPTGAGDCFNAGFLHALIGQAASPHEAVVAGMACAEKAVSGHGLPLGETDL